MRNAARAQKSSLRPWLTTLVAMLLVAVSSSDIARGDWLVTKEGARIETDGAWKVKGRVIVFTQPGGTLSSIRLSEVDLEASHDATETAKAPPQEEAPAEEPSPPPPPVLTITDADVGRGQEGISGRQLLIEKLRNAHSFKNVDMAMALVNLQGTPSIVRDALRQEFEWLMERQIRDIEMNEVENSGNLEEVAEDGVTYKPNVEVTHQLIVELEPDQKSQRLTMSFYVGQRLGQYFIAAANPAGR